jgi:hypothetical protein
MSKWNLIVDVPLCENCHNCTLAAKDEHVGNDFPGYAAPMPKRGHDWIRIERKVRGSAPMVDAVYLPKMCNHCDDAMRAQAQAEGLQVLQPGLGTKPRVYYRSLHRYTKCFIGGSVYLGEIRLSAG